MKCVQVSCECSLPYSPFLWKRVWLRSGATKRLVLSRWITDCEPTSFVVLRCFARTLLGIEGMQPSNHRRLADREHRTDRQAGIVRSEHGASVFLCSGLVLKIICPRVLRRKSFFEPLVVTYKGETLPPHHRSVCWSKSLLNPPGFLERLADAVANDCMLCVQVLDHITRSGSEREADNQPPMLKIVQGRQLSTPNNSSSDHPYLRASENQSDLRKARVSAISRRPVWERGSANRSKAVAIRRRRSSALACHEALSASSIGTAARRVLVVRSGWVIANSRPVPPAQHSDDGCLVVGKEVEHSGRRRRGCLQHQIVTLDLHADAGGTCCLEGLSRTHSRRLHTEFPIGGSSSLVSPCQRPLASGPWGGIEFLLAMPPMVPMTIPLLG